MFEKFYERYDSEEKEVIALIQRTLGAGYNNGFWDMAVISLGMVFCDTGKADIREGRLEWPVTEEEKNSEKGWNRFAREQICRIKVRKLLDEYVPKHISPEKNNSWAITEVLEHTVACPKLETVLMEYKKPVIIEDKVLGTLTLNRDFYMFESSLLWKGNQVSFMLEVNPDSKSSWSRARSAAQQLVKEQDSWDKAMRIFAAKELTSLANVRSLQTVRNVKVLTSGIWKTTTSFRRLNKTTLQAFTKNNAMLSIRNTTPIKRDTTGPKT